jgi:hypothetical protein
MSMVPLHRFERPQRPLEPVRHRGSADPAEIARRHSREQVNAEIRR